MEKRWSRLPLESILLALVITCFGVMAWAKPPEPKEEEEAAAPAAPATPESDAPKPAKNEARPAEDENLSADEAKLAEQFRQLEQAMLRLAEVSAGSDPRRAAVLKQAVKESGSREIKIRFEALVKLLEGKSPQYSLAINNQTELKSDLDKLLELLLKEDRAGRIESEKKRIERMLKEVGRIIKEERGVKARTEGGDDLQQLEGAQGKIADKTQGLADELAKNPSQAQPGDGGKSEQNGEKKNEGEQKQDGKNENDGDQKSDGDSKNQGDTERKGDSKNKGDKESKGDSENKGDNKSEGNSEREGDNESKGDSKREGDSKNKGNSKSKGDSKNEGDSEQKGNSESKGDSEREGNSKNKGNTKSKGDQKSEGNSKSKGDSENEGNIETEGNSKSKSQGGGDSEGNSKSKGDAKIKGSDKESSDPVRKRIQAAQDRMKDAQKKLQEAERKGATEEQRKAIDELEQAKAELEKILRQLREEEVERMLAMLEGRFKKMLEWQILVYEGTLRLDKVPDDERDRDHEIETGRLSRKEAEIVREADKALTLLHDEGSSIAFPESIGQMRDDMEQVVVLLAQKQTDIVTQGVEEDIIAALEEMIAALKKAQKDAEERKNQDGKMQDGQQQDQSLVDALAELKMIRALQMRVNKRTETYSKMIQGEQAERPELLKALEKLGERQQRIHAVTRDLHLGKNQ